MCLAISHPDTVVDLLIPYTVSKMATSLPTPNNNNISNAWLQALEESTRCLRPPLSNDITLLESNINYLTLLYKNREKPNGNKQKKIANEAVEIKINDHIKQISTNENEKINYGNINQKKPEELIGLIDNILNYVNTQKEKSEGIDVENDDESEISCEVLFGKFYYDLNKTIFNKIESD